MQKIPQKRTIPEDRWLTIQLFDGWPTLVVFNEKRDALYRIFLSKIMQNINAINRQMEN